MNWVEYRLEDDSVIKVPYNRCNVAPVSKKVLEQLINTFNESIRQAKILEYIKTNYADRMREQYDKGRADAIKELKDASVIFDGEEIYGSETKMILITKEKYNEIFIRKE